MLLRKYVTKAVSVSSRAKFSSVGAAGMSVGGVASTSRGGLSEVESIQSSGRMAWAQSPRAPR
jgi:hypothetical protein